MSPESLERPRLGSMYDLPRGEDGDEAKGEEERLRDYLEEQRPMVEGAQPRMPQPVGGFDGAGRSSKLQAKHDRHLERKARYSKAMRGHNITKNKQADREAQLLSSNPPSEGQEKKQIRMVGKNIGLDPIK